MNLSEQVNEFANGLVLFAAFPFTGVALIYGFRSEWYKTVLGVITLSLFTSLAAVLLFVSARRAWGEFFGYEWFAVLIYGWVSISSFAFLGIFLVERRRSEILTIPLNRRQRRVDSRATSHSSKEPPMTDQTATLEPPKIWYSTQRALRTALAFLITAVPILNAVAGATIDYLREQEGVAVPAWVFLVLNGILAVTTLIIGLVSKWMATPGFNKILTAIGLGSVPKKSLVEARTVEDGQVHVITAVLPDPKAVEANAVPGVLRSDLD